MRICPKLDYKSAKFVRVLKAKYIYHSLYLRDLYSWGCCGGHVINAFSGPGGGGGVVAKTLWILSMNGFNAWYVASRRRQRMVKISKSSFPGRGEAPRWAPGAANGGAPTPATGVHRAGAETFAIRPGSPKMA
jgi:hypothetical protein